MDNKKGWQTISGITEINLLSKDKEYIGLTYGNVDVCVATANYNEFEYYMHRRKRLYFRNMFGIKISFTLKENNNFIKIPYGTILKLQVSNKEGVQIIK